VTFKSECREWNIALEDSGIQFKKIQFMLFYFLNGSYHPVKLWEDGGRQ
jgi:hypothetical protein